MGDPALETLLAGCALQNRKDQKALYKSHYGYCLAICLRYAGNRYEAAEIMNQGFFKVFTKLELYDRNKPFKAWLGRIMINTAINYYHSNLRTSQMEDLELVEEFDKHSLADSKLRYDELLAMVQELPPSFRSVFNLYAIEGYDHQEIAEMMNISEATSRSHLFKAREKLKKKILAAERPPIATDRSQNDSNIRMMIHSPSYIHHLNSFQP